MKIVYTITERDNKSFWTKVGIAYTNKDGSISVKLDAIPVNGTLQIRNEPGSICECCDEKTCICK